MADTRISSPSWWRRWLHRMADPAQGPEVAVRSSAADPVRALRKLSPALERSGDFLDTDSSWTYRIEPSPEAPRHRAPVLD